MRQSDTPIRTQMKIRGYTDTNRIFDIGEPAFIALKLLMAAGASGVASADLGTPAPAKTVHEFRKKGLVIETKRANDLNGGKGLDLRYVLRSAVSFTELTVIKEYWYVII